MQTLLRLDYIGVLRRSLYAYANKCKKDADTATSGKANAANAIKNMLGVTKLDWQEVLEKANSKRAIIGLSPIDKLSGSTSFVGAVATSDDEKKTKIPSKEVALGDLNALLDSTEDESQNDVVLQTDVALKVLNAFKEDRDALVLARRHGLIKTGLAMISDDACPLCDKQWDADELKAHLEKKLLTAEEIGKPSAPGDRPVA